MIQTDNVMSPSSSGRLAVVGYYVFLGGDFAASTSLRLLGDFNCSWQFITLALCDSIEFILCCMV